MDFISFPSNNCLSMKEPSIPATKLNPHLSKFLMSHGLLLEKKVLIISKKVLLESK